MANSDRRPARRVSRFLPGALFLVAVLDKPEAKAAERAYIEVRSPHFVVVSDAGEKPARRVAWQFEQIHALIPRLWPWARVTMPRPILVLAVRSEAGMKALLPEYWERKGAIHPHAFVVSGRDRHYMAVRADTEFPRDDMRENPYRMAYWSYVALVFGQSFEQELPLWFSRGITDVFANTIVRDETVELGRVIPWQLQRLARAEPLSFAKLRSIDRSSPYYRQEDKLQDFDARAWAVIHYIMFAEKGAHLTALNRFGALLRNGTSAEVALAEAFPDLKSLEQGIDRYVANVAFGYHRIGIDLEVKKEGFSARPLPVAEAAAVRAAFHVAMNRPGEARTLLEEGMKADPASPQVWEATGLLAEREDRTEDAKAAFAKASAQPGAGYYALYRYAQGLFGAERPGPDTLERIETALRLSLRGNPAYSFGHSYLAETLVQLGKAAEAEAIAREAIALDPAEAYHHVALARVLSSLGRAEEARKEGGKGLALARRPDEKEYARTTLGYIQQEEEARRGRTEAATTRTTSAAAREADGAVVDACRSGEAAACAKLLPSYEAACGEDQAQACAAVASFHERGLGVPRDAERAGVFYMMACDRGEKRACLSLAVMQAEGRGISRNEAEARTRMEGLCAEGMPEACTFLATLHLNRGTAKDLTRARELLAQACEARDEQACRTLKALPPRPSSRR